MKRRMTALLMIAALAMLALSGCAKKEKPLADTLRFFNATYALITTVNGGDYKIVSGFDTKDNLNVTKLKDGLESAWDVTDKATAQETMEWLTTGGHNEELVQKYKDNTMDSFTREELVSVLSSDDFKEGEKIAYLCMYDAVQKFGDNAILAWDLCRAEQLLSWYYLVGYYTYEEAMDKSLEVAKTLQNSFSSWDEMMESYLLGYQYWAEEDITDTSSEAYSRSKLFEELKSEEDGPYSVAWDTQLQKEW